MSAWTSGAKRKRTWLRSPETDVAERRTPEQIVVENEEREEVAEGPGALEGERFFPPHDYGCNGRKREKNLLTGNIGREIRGCSSSTKFTDAAKDHPSGVYGEKIWRLVRQGGIAGEPAEWLRAGRPMPRSRVPDFGSACFLFVRNH
jgi:hypothetical protein